MNIDIKLLQLLYEIGYLAGANGLFQESEIIFEAIKQIRPESEYPYVGLAVTRMNMGKNEEAICILRDHALKINPESDIAKAFLGLALKFAGLIEQSRSVLQEVIDKKRDEVAIRMAAAILDEMK